MLCTDEKNLSEQIVEALAEFPLMSAYELQDLIDERQKFYSIQAVYQELRKLDRLEVVMRVKNKYMLRVGWIDRISHMMDDLHSHYIEHSPFEELLPREGKIEFKMKSLQRAVRLLIRLWTTILETGEPKTIYQHVQHIWFHLILEEESKYLETIKAGDHKYYVSSVHNTFLDRMYKRTFPEFNVKVINGKSCLSPKKDYTTVVEPYIIKTTLSSRLKQDLSNLFYSVKSASDIIPGQITELVTRNSPIRLSLENNPIKARRLSKKMANFFGVKE